MEEYLLINSPISWENTNSNEDYLPPLGMGYIATYLKRAGIKVELIDCVKEEICVSDIIKLINIRLPKYVGINVFTPNYDIVKYILENCSDNICFFIGGQVIKFIYEEILSWNITKEINIIIGEAEFIVPDIVRNCCIEQPIATSGNKRVYKVDQRSSYYPKDISEIYLDRTFFKNEVLLNHYYMNEACILSSRGCIYNCAFCGGAKGLNKDVQTRKRNKESIITEIEEIISIYPNIQSIRILDDLFLRDTDSIDMAINIFSKFNQLYWRGMGHVLSFIDNTQKIRLLRESGCKELFIGIESGSKYIRKKINKKGDIQEIIDVVGELLENGIDVKGYFMYGFPNETLEDFEDTYKLAMKLRKLSNLTAGNFRTSTFQFRPYHGTQLYNEIIQEKGSILSYQPNNILNESIGRNQFNLQSGNYSKEADETLNEYIIKTQELTRS